MIRIVCLLLAIASLIAADSDFSGRFELTFDQVLIQSTDAEVPQHRRTPLTIIATCRAGVWEDLWGHALRYNKSQHRGLVRSFTRSNDTYTLTGGMVIEGDAWIPGNALEFAATLTERDGILEGSYQGTLAYAFGGPTTVTGSVTGVLLPAPQTVDGFAELKPDEFPRLLFRQSDIPRLQRKLATPFGQHVRSMMEESKNPTCLGVLYQLTGDQQYARQAIDGVRAKMQETAGGAFAVGRVWGYRIEYVAYAYDLCHQAWPEAFNREVEAWLDWIVPKCIDEPWGLSSAVNITPGSNYMTVIWGGSAKGAIVRMGVPGPEPIPPRSDFAEAAVIESPPAFTPGKGVPINAYRDGMMPARWLWAGGWKTTDIEADPLANVDVESIELDSALTLGEHTSHFRPVPEEGRYRCSMGKFTKGDALNLAVVFVPEGGKKEDSYHRTGWFYSVLEVHETTPVRLQAPDNNAAEVDAAWISGRRLVHGDLATLAPGRHPMLMHLRSLDLVPNPWGQMLIEPRLETLSEERLTQLTAGRRMEQAIRHGLWQRDQADWQRLGGIDIGRYQLAQRGARWNALSCQGSMQDGGFQAEGEGYTLECHHPLIGYAVVHRNVFGVDLTGRPDASHFAPRYLASTVFSGQIGKQGRPAYRNLTYGGGGGSIHDIYLGRAMALCPPAWQSSLLHFWHQKAGVDRQAETERAIAAIAAFPHDTHLAYAFIHYPLDLEPTSPEGVFPKWWAADGKGYYSFRNAYRDGDDIVATIYAKDGKSAGWSAAEAGCFQIHGLGHTWAAKGKHDRGGGRAFDNVVQLPDDTTRDGARCRVLFRQGDADTGSGSVSIDLDPVYQIGEPIPDRPKKLRWIDGGIRGWRAFAADYSGRSGTPAAFAVADHVTGGTTKVWEMHVPDIDESTTSVTIADKQFIITKGDASLVGTVIAPSGATIEATTAEQEARVGAGRKHRDGKTRFTFKGIRITGPTRTEGEFFITFTLQNGPAPAVSIEGHGLQARATVGDLNWSLDDKRLVAQ